MKNSEFNNIGVIGQERDLDDYDVLTLPMISAAVPYYSDEEYRKYIWAAMVTYAWGNKSVDHTLKYYKKGWEIYKKNYLEQQNPRIILLRELIQTINKISNKLESINTNKKHNLSYICSRSALIRLEATFKSAYGLIRKDYIFESTSLARMILEQLSWAFVAFDTKKDKLSSLKPNKCITKFKAFYSNSGKLYGELSKWSHIDPFVVNEYKKFHDSKLAVVRRSEFNSLQNGVYLFVLSQQYLKLSQSKIQIFKEKKYREITLRIAENTKEYLEITEKESK